MSIIHVNTLTFVSRFKVKHLPFHLLVLLHVFVIAEALVRNHSLQTAQSLLQEEVVHSEEQSEVRTPVYFFSLLSFQSCRNVALLVLFYRFSDF